MHFSIGIGKFSCLNRRVSLVSDKEPDLRKAAFLSQSLSAYGSYQVPILNYDSEPSRNATDLNVILTIPHIVLHLYVVSAEQWDSSGME
jgi:hypothetical protein